MPINLDASQEVARFCLDRGLVDLVRFKQAETQSKASGKAAGERRQRGAWPRLLINGALKTKRICKRSPREAWLRLLPLPYAQQTGKIHATLLTDVIFCVFPTH